jgi:hypothetical protein
MWFIAAPAPAGTPELPQDAYKKTAEADLKFLQTRLEELSKAAAPNLRSAKPALATALLLATYADGLGDKKLREDAIKVAEAVNDKKYKDALELASKITIKPGTGGGKGDLPKLEAFEKAKDKDVTYLPHTMALFANKTVLQIPRGMNIEKDLKDWTNKANPPKLDFAAVEILATRSAVLNEFAFHNPNEKARNKPESLREWQKFSKNSVDLSKELATEAGKKAPEAKKVRDLLNKLDASCTDCHGKYRYDD